MGDGLSVARKPTAIHRHNLTCSPRKSEGELGCSFLLWNRVNNPWGKVLTGLGAIVGSVLTVLKDLGQVTLQSSWLHISRGALPSQHHVIHGLFLLDPVAYSFLVSQSIEQG